MSRGDLEAELRHHIRERADALMSEGWSEDDALREARRRFGDPATVTRELERIRDDGPAARVLDAAAFLAGEVRHVLRGFRLEPGFAAAVVATLALGVGASTGIFAVVDAVLLRPLDYRQPESLAHVQWSAGDGPPAPYMPASVWRGWRDRDAGAVEAWIPHARRTVVRLDGPAPEEVTVLGVAPGGAEALGMPLLLGRGFTPDDAEPGARPVAVLTRGYWDRLGSDRSVLGTTIRLEGGPVTVVGVLRRGVKFPAWGPPPELWMPFGRDGRVAGLEAPWVDVWARLRPGVSRAAAQERLDVTAAALTGAAPAEDRYGLVLQPVDAYRASPGATRALWTLAGTAAAILLVAVVNGVNLVLVRTTGRRREMAVRAALGGSRARRLVRSPVEGLLLGLAGGGAGLLLAVGALAAIRGLVPDGLAYFAPHAPARPEARAALFALGSAVVAGVVLGLAPVRAVLVAGRSAVTGAGAGESRSARGLRRVLVGGQVALSTALLAGAGLVLHSFARLVAVDPGYAYERMVEADLSLSAGRYPTGAERADFVRRLDAALEAHPAFVSATLSGGTGFSRGPALEPEDGAVPSRQPELVPRTAVAPDFLAVRGVELVAGRSFGPADVSAEVAVVDRDLARFLWGRDDVVGRRFRIGDEGVWRTVVGVVGDLRMMGRDQRDGPYQVLRPLDPSDPGAWLSVSARTAGEPDRALGAFREVVSSVDPLQTLARLRTGADALAEREEAPRFLAALMSALAGVAVALASVGLYGVLSHSVRRRGRELGVRMALGADPVGLRRMVLRDGVTTAGAGVVAGLGLALLGARLVESLLYDLGPRDPATLAATAALLLAVAAAASLLPARRATRVDPVRVLSAE